MKLENIKIAFYDTKPYDMDFFDRENRNWNFKFKYFKEHLSPDTAMMSKGFDAVCIFVNDVVNKEVVDILHENGVKLIILRCAGYNNVDLQAVFGKIHVVRVPAYSPYAVAEHAVALMLTLNRKVHRAYYRVRDNNFSISGLLGFDMHGKTAGLVGTGKIGQCAGRILAGFGMKILAYDRYQDEAFIKATGTEYCELDRLYRESDIITLHCPLTPETQHMINAESIDKMKKGVMLINSSRGSLIDTAALIEGLKSGKIGSAGLDVYEEESEYFFEDKSDAVIKDDILARLLSFNNVIVTSHQAFFTGEALTNIASTSLENAVEFFENRPLKNEICYYCNAGTSKPCPKKAENLPRCF